MKFPNVKVIFLNILFAALSLPPVFAQGNRDFMRETGKINVVTATIVAIFLGIAWYLFRLDRKLTNIERQIFNDNERKN